MLLEETFDSNWTTYESDLEKILNAGRQLLTQVRYYFDDSQTRPAKLDLPRVQHEFRTPLNHIIGYAEILIEQAEDFEDTIKIKDLEPSCPCRIGARQEATAGDQTQGNRILSRQRYTPRRCPFLCGT